jgi:hypothetical protein
MAVALPIVFWHWAGHKGKAASLLPHFMDFTFEKGFYLFIRRCINGEKAMEGEL